MSIQPEDAQHPLFCLHLKTESSVAGTMCTACGLVVSTINHAAEGRGPVAMKAPGDASLVVLEQARQEWEQQVGKVVDQPREVLQHAWLIFQRVYESNGVVSGAKARALVLVSLLYCNRLLHGSNGSNEEYLLKTLSTPTRVMNKAFTLMASVALPPTVADTPR